MTKRNIMWDFLMEHIEDIKQDYGILKPNEIEIKYNVSYDYFRKWCCKQNIKSNKPHLTKKWSNEESQMFKKDWEDGVLTIKELEVKYDRNRQSLYGKAQLLNVYRNTNIKKITDKDILYICNQYENGTNSRVLSEEFNVAQSTILQILRNNNIQIRERTDCLRKYTINHNYFDIIDNEHKAYWLGFLMADGYNKEDRNAIVLSLQKEDEYILKEFLKDVGSNKEISYVYNKQFDSYSAKAYVNSVHMSQQLSKLGVVQNKSFICKYPYEYIPQELEHHFIRGLFDGDGCISFTMGGVNKNKVHGRFSIANGSKDFLEDIYNIVNINDMHIYKNHNIYDFTTCKYSNIKQMYNYLYKDATIYLTRKQNKFEKYLSYYKEE